MTYDFLLTTNYLQLSTDDLWLTTYDLLTYNYHSFMKFQIGDKIIVLHSDEEGEVVDIINEKMVMIEVKGVKFPAYNDQIDFPYFKMFTQKKIEPKRKIYAEDIKKEKPTDYQWISLCAEEEGFEPPDPCGSPVFKTGAINRSTTPL